MGGQSLRDVIDFDGTQRISPDAAENDACSLGLVVDCEREEPFFVLNRRFHLRYADHTWFTCLSYQQRFQHLLVWLILLQYSTYLTRIKNGFHKHRLESQNSKFNSVKYGFSLTDLDFGYCHFEKCIARRNKIIITFIIIYGCKLLELDWNSILFNNVTDNVLKLFRR